MELVIVLALQHLGSSQDHLQQHRTANHSKRNHQFKIYRQIHLYTQNKNDEEEDTQTQIHKSETAIT